MFGILKKSEEIRSNFFRNQDETFSEDVFDHMLYQGADFCCNNVLKPQKFLVVPIKTLQKSEVNRKYVVSHNKYDFSVFSIPLSNKFNFYS